MLIGRSTGARCRAAGTAPFSLILTSEAGEVLNLADAIKVLETDDMPTTSQFKGAMQQSSRKHQDDAEGVRVASLATWILTLRHRVHAVPQWFCLIKSCTQQTYL